MRIAGGPKGIALCLAIVSLAALAKLADRPARAQEGAGAGRSVGRLFLMHFLDRQKGFGLADLGNNTTNVVRTTNGGAAWTGLWRFHGDFTFNDLFFLNTRHGFITTESRLMETTDGGESWGRIQIPHNYDLRKIRFLGGRGWVLGLPPTRSDAGPIVLYSVDIGQHWMPDAFVRGSAIDFCIADATHAWMVDDDGIQQSTNGARTWTQKRAADGLRAVACNGTDRAWALHSRQVLRTLDAGATWTTHEIGGTATNDFTALAFASPTNGWAYNEQELRGTEDGGATWTDRAQAPGPPTFLDGRVGYALDGNGGLHWTEDGGRTWP